MSHFLLALQFLTVIPLKIKESSEQKMADSVVYFPLIGLAIGLLLIVVNTLLSYLNFPNLTLNVILVVTLIIVSGGMHLDGLSDTADAFLSGKPKEEMLNIMRDPHVGVMGVLSLASIIFLKIALLFSVNGSLRQEALILMCVASRWSVVPQMFFFPYARKEGKASAFIQGMTLKTFIISTVIVILCASLVWGIKGLITLLAAVVFVYIIGKLASSKIGGITGDTLGATIELTEVITLLSVCITGGMIYG